MEHTNRTKIFKDHHYSLNSNSLIHFRWHTRFQPLKMIFQITLFHVSSKCLTSCYHITDINICGMLKLREEFLKYNTLIRYEKQYYFTSSFFLVIFSPAFRLTHCFLFHLTAFQTINKPTCGAAVPKEVSHMTAARLCLITMVNNHAQKPEP